MRKQEEDKAMTSEDPIERRAALMIKDFVRVHGGGEMPIDDYIPIIAATLAGRDTGCVNPADVDFNLTMLIQDAIDNYSDDCVAAPMALAELVRQIRTLEIR
jgi:hypothetical protein